MSRLIRFKNEDIKIKALVYERGSRKLDCMCCGQRRFGILIRHKEPKRIPDTLICYECIVRMSLGILIEIDDKTKFGPYSEADIIADAPRRDKNVPGFKAGEKNSKCCYCDEMFTERGLPLHIKAKHAGSFPVSASDDNEDNNVFISSNGPVANGLNKVPDLIESENGQEKETNTKSD